MNLLRMFLPVVAALFAASFAACDTPHKSPPEKTAKKSASVSSGAQDVGRKTEKAFRHAGGAMEKFFTGHDTISR